MSQKLRIKRIRKQLNQDQIMYALSTPRSRDGKSMTEVQYMLFDMLVDAYDQNLTREAFANLVWGALVARAYGTGTTSIMGVEATVAAEKFTPEIVANTIEYNLACTNETLADLAGQYALVKECRSEEDPVS